MIVIPSVRTNWLKPTHVLLLRTLIVNKQCPFTRISSSTWTTSSLLLQYWILHSMFFTDPWTFKWTSFSEYNFKTASVFFKPFVFYPNFNPFRFLCFEHCLFSINVSTLKSSCGTFYIEPNTSETLKLLLRPEHRYELLSVTLWRTLR